MLDDARHVRNPHVAKRIRSMASIVKDQSLFRIDGIQEVAAKSDGKPDYSCDVARGRVVLDVLRLQWHGAEKTHIVRGRHEDEGVSVRARPFDRRKGRLAR